MRFANHSRAVTPPLSPRLYERDGAEELCSLPKCKSDPETFNDWETNMQRVFLQSDVNQSPQYHHSVEALQTGRPSRHLGIWGKR